MMTLIRSLALALALLASSASAVPAGPSGVRGGIVYNSGICERDEEADSRSGYLSVGPGKEMWFWMFEQRRKNAGAHKAKAPLVFWPAAGPGASSILHVMEDNGPCRFKDEDSAEPEWNPYSFNSVANMVYIDHPFGTGLTPGNPSEVQTTEQAVGLLWEFMQSFLDRFKEEFADHDIYIAAPSYGGHFGPRLLKLIGDKNAAGEGKRRIDVKGLAVSSGSFSYRITLRSWIEYAYANAYGKRIGTERERDDLLERFDAMVEANPEIGACEKDEGTHEECAAAFQAIAHHTETNLFVESRWPVDMYDTRRIWPPPHPTVEYLNRGDRLAKIGSKVDTFVEGNTLVRRNFDMQGDPVRSEINTLSQIAQTGLPLMLWGGDADFITNTVGILEVARSIRFHGQAEFAKKEPRAWKAGHDADAGRSIVQDNLSFLEIKGAGHALGKDQPEATLEAFRQFLEKGRLD